MPDDSADDNTNRAFPRWLPEALNTPVLDVERLWREGEYPDLAEQCIVTPCVDCRAAIGIPTLAGRCLVCDQRELRRDMPPHDRLELDLHLRTALGYIGAETTPYKEYLSRDASYWDNRMFRGWRNFRIQLLAVANLGRLPAALPMRWTLTLDALPPDSHASRLPLEPVPSRESLITWNAETRRRLDEKIAIVRIRLWRPGEPGYLQGLWDGQRQRILWDLRDMGGGIPAQRGMWWKAMDEARTVGRPQGVPESREDLVAAIRVALELSRASGVNVEQLPRKQWREALAGFIRLPPNWMGDDGMPDSTLRDHLRAHGLSLRAILPDLYDRH